MSEFSELSRRGTTEFGINAYVGELQNIPLELIRAPSPLISIGQFGQPGFYVHKNMELLERLVMFHSF